MVSEEDLRQMGFKEFSGFIKTVVATGKKRTVVLETLQPGMRFQYPKETPPPFFVTKFRARGKSGALFVDKEGRTFLAERLLNPGEVARLVQNGATEVVDGMKVASF